MKIIYRGGYNKKSEESTKKSVIYDYAATVKKLLSHGKAVAYVTLAKPDNFFDNYFFPLLPNTIKIIDSKNNKNADWKKFDVIFFLGGDAEKLHKGLTESRFTLDNLKKDAVLIGDSAGAMVLSSYYADYKDDLKSQIVFFEGLNPKAKVIPIVHINNPNYVSPNLISSVHLFAEEKKLKVLELKENEEKLLTDDGSFVDFDKQEVF